MRRAPPSITPVAAAALATIACSSSPATPANPAPTPAAEHPSGGESVAPTPTPSGNPGFVHAREAPRMPVCRADEPVALASLANAFSARPAIARGPAGGLAAFLADPDHDGAPDLVLQPLDAHGQRAGASVTLTAGPGVAFPALAPEADHYLLAYREGPAEQQRIVVRPVAADGNAGAPVRNLEFVPAWYGPPSVAVTPAGRVIAAIQSRAVPPDPDALEGQHLVLASDTHVARRIALPDAQRWDGSVAPVLVRGGDRVRVFALAARAGAMPGDERALFEIGDGEGADALRVVARDVDFPAVSASPAGALLAWRARLAPDQSGARAYVLPRDGSAPRPPVTLDAYRGAFDLPVVVVPAGPHIVAALTLSQLSDSDAASLDLSAMTDAGEYLGRRVGLASVPARGVGLVAAGGDDGAWLLLEQRDDRGNAALSLTRVSCDAERAVEPLDVPPATLPQEATNPGAAPVTLASPTGSCTNARPPLGVSVHHSGVDDAAAGTSAAVVALPHATVAFAAVRTDGPTHLTVVTAREDGTRLEPVDRPEPVGAVLAAGAVGDEAVAIVTAADGSLFRVVRARGDAAAPTITEVRLPGAESAVISPESGALFVVAGTAARPGDRTLYRLSLRGRARPAPLALASLRPGDRVLDAAPSPGGTTVLLSRPDRLGGAISAAFARVVSPDRATAPSRSAALPDPFDSPFAFGGGDAALVPAGTTPVFVRNAGATLRAGALGPGGVDGAHPALETLGHGGAIVSRSHTPRGIPWLLVATGSAPEGGTRASAFTLVSLGPAGRVLAAVPAATTRAGEPEALDGAASVSASGARVAVLYRSVQSDGALAWVLWQADCAATATAPQGGR